MKSLKLKLLGGAVLLAAAGLAGTASATDIHGGGATLPAPAIAQAFGCYSGATTGADYLVRNSSGVLVDTAEKPCPANIASPVVSTNAYHYAGTGSGLGIAGFFSHDPSRYGTYPASAFPSVEFGLSDNALKQSDIDAYRNGGTVQGVTVVAPGATPTSGQYANPFQKYGDIIQVPNVIAAVAIAYKVPAGVTINTASGKLELTKTDLCKVFDGSYAYWDQIPNVTGHVRLLRVGRADSSGTTSLFTRHMAAICVGMSRNKFKTASGTSTLPSTSGWRLGTGNSGVYALLDGTKGTIGYVGSEYLVGSTLNAASIQEGTSATFLQPTAANATKAFNSLGFVAPSGDAQKNPLNWVPTDINSAVENPTSGYPIIGTSNTLLYSCYSSSAKVNALISPTSGALGFFRWYYTNTIVNSSSGLLAANGVAPLPSAMRTSVYNFLRASIRYKNQTGCTGKGA
ncbi:substrate-binding domain-containing protein [Zavarzinia aquatilis]|nr:substrate-binding domain-containing protein [Zavarzinia aquatilis]